MDYQTKHVQSLFNISPETVRIWCNTFSEFLSPGAMPNGSGQHRRFSYEDMTVFALISELRAQGMGYDEIYASLSGGARGDIPDEIMTDTESALALQMDHSRRLIQQMKIERDKVQSELDKLSRIEAERDLLREIREQQQQQINQLNRQLQTLYAKLGYYQGLLKRRQD